MRKVACTNTYINKIKPIIRKTSFSQLKIDEIAKYMDISKATLYKRFSSKDEIIQAVVEDYINYLLEGDLDNQDEGISYAERFQKTFIHSLKCVTYISDVFLQDLKESYPHLWDQLVVAQQNRNHNLQVFFESGMQQGVFNQINAQLFMVQDEVVLRRIMDQSFCIQYDITLKQALIDFYNLKKYQLFKPQYLDTANDSIIAKEIIAILQMIS
ncbi:TetR/AcrR family transcriptional regulator [Bacillus gaemokensis]|uniref:TetR family transcriptional regulator n=1 Tax=Bacillus gaemokensis TaxID=574375 RepID=A0A073KLY4_9BACI|nr:TetR/AcrR family transcriptional regulator [Bacillus gaemokensis]KEK23363.1 TetR family transcriptional regulator [Bacillus gaemokensis]KYG37852.1 TetR family transcriptional regulator [Bacillus gaemokensis]